MAGARGQRVMDTMLTATDRLVRAYRTLAATLDVAASAETEDELVRRICEVATHDAGYRMAWIGYVGEAPALEVRAVAHAGATEGYLESIRVTARESAEGRGPTGTAIRTGRSAVVHHIASDPAMAPWRDEALTRGYSSSAALPLMDGDHAFGALMVYAAEPDAFGHVELELLERVARVVQKQILSARGRVRLGAIEGALTRLDSMVASVRAAATVAHDVNNCLSVVSMAVAALPDGSTKHNAQEALMRATRMNRDLLGLARTSHDRSEATLVDLVVSTSATALERLAAPAPIAFSLAAEGWRARIAEDMLRRVLENLVANARDATEQGGEVRVETSTLVVTHPVAPPFVGVEEGQWVRVRVSDTGTGMTESVRANAFAPFFTTKEPGKGTGLGLASVLAIARAAGGHVFLASARGEGTTVDVLLRRAT